MNKYLLLLVSVFLFASCSNEEVSIDSVPENELIIENSAAMRASFEAIRENNSSKSPAKAIKNPENLCFQFIYPITLAYNTEAIVEVSSYEALLEILLQESLENHITGIGFPFEIQIKETEEILVINDETEFKELINSCGYDTLDYAGVVEVAKTCFDISYPISLLVNNESVKFESEAAAQSYFQANFSSIVSITVDYPLNVTLNDTEEITSINDDYELIYLIKETCGFN